MGGNWTFWGNGTGNEESLMGLFPELHTVLREHSSVLDSWLPTYHISEELCIPNERGITELRPQLCKL